MTTRTDIAQADSPGVLRIGKRLRWTWRALTVVGVVGTVMGVAGYVRGSLWMTILGALLFAVSGAGLTVGWLVLAVALMRRSPSRRHWLTRLAVATVCWAGISATVCMVWRQSVQVMHAFRHQTPSSDAEMRLLCHRCLLWNPDPHDPIVWLVRDGDASSVPYLIWVIRWPSLSCGRSHAIEALERITNHSLGTTHAAWSKWYARNRHRSEVEWWADGFRAEGYAVSTDGGPESIRALLGVLGRSSWCRPPASERLSLNAHRMLALLSPEDVQAVMVKALRDGRVEERRGVVHRAGELSRATAEPLLNALLDDSDRSVRLTASGVLSLRRLTWLRARPVRQERGDLGTERFIAREGRNVALPKSASQIAYGRKAVVTLVVGADPRTPEQACVIRIHRENYEWDSPASLTLEGRSSAAARPTYSTHLIDSNINDMGELRWLYDDTTGHLFVSTPRYTCLADPHTGKVVWEMGFGTGNCDYLFLLGEYVLVSSYEGLTLCDAARGGVLASYALPGFISESSLSLVDGQLRAADREGQRYILPLPK